MTTKSQLSAYDLLRKANEQGESAVAAWIDNRIREDEERIESAAAQPIDTPAGRIVPGRRYNVTLSVRHYGREPGSRVLKNVTLKRGSYGDGTFVYSSGRTAAHLYTTGSGQVIAIEELS